jgi:hypothetical protein
MPRHDKGERLLKLKAKAWTLKTILVPAYFALSGLPAFGQSQDLQPLEQYVQANNFETNPGALGHVFLRCASVLFIMSAATQSDVSLQSVSKKFKDTSDAFLDAALQNGASEEFVSDQMLRMAASYKERYLSAKANSGNFSDDPVIRSDVTLCAALAAKK